MGIDLANNAGDSDKMEGFYSSMKAIAVERDSLQVRIGEMASEIERLQSVIDEANALPSVGIADFQYQPDGTAIVEISLSKQGDLNPGDELFTRPIPAQQSPAVAAPDYKEDLFQLRQKAENWSTKLGLITSVINSRKISLSAKEREFPHMLIERLHTDSELLKQRGESPRITEQDARHAIKETFLANGFTIKDGQTDLKPYVYDAAFALLNKLNDKPESVGGSDE